MLNSKGIGIRFVVGISAIIIAAIGIGAFAFTGIEEEPQPNVQVKDQTLSDSTVTVNRVVAREDGWIVIHRDDNGTPGEVIGYEAVETGINSSIGVELDNTNITERLYAMLHFDTGQEGTYGFPEEDPPVETDGEIVVTSFRIEMSSEPGFEWFMASNEFSPGEIEVDVGTTVRITNQDGFIHNFTARNPETGEVVVNQNIAAGESFEFTFDAEGVWKVWCTIHSDGTGSEPATTGMKGRVGVGVSIDEGNNGSGNGLY